MKKEEAETLLGLIEGPASDLTWPESISLPGDEARLLATLARAGASVLFPDEGRVETRVAKLRTAADVSATAVEHWRKQYARYASDHRLFGGRTVREIDVAMVAAQGDLEKIAAIHGERTSGWSHPQCTGCGEYVDTVAIIGVDHDENDIQICEGCARAALAGME
jgi:hypothetical protein